MPPSGGRASGGQLGGGGAAVCAAENCLVVALPASGWMVVLAPLHTMSMVRAAHVVDLRLSVQVVVDMGRGGRRRLGHWCARFGIVTPLATQAHVVAADLDPTLENTIAADTHMSLLNIMAILTDNLAAILKVSYEK